MNTVGWLEETFWDSVISTILSLNEDGKFINLSVSMNGGNGDCTMGRLDAATRSDILHLLGQENLICNRDKSGKRCLCQPCKVTARAAYQHEAAST